MEEISHQRVSSLWKDSKIEWVHIPTIGGGWGNSYNMGMGKDSNVRRWRGLRCHCHVCLRIVVMVIVGPFWGFTAEGLRRKRRVLWLNFGAAK